MAKRSRRPWTEADDALLRKFHAEGKADPTIAYIMDRDRVLIGRRRRRLKLKPISHGGGTGDHLSEEGRARIGACTRQRWADPEYRQRMVPKCRHGLECAKAKRFKQPDRSTPEFRAYRKIRDNLGPREAKIEMGYA